MRPLKIAIAVQKFPNLAQTYILRLIAGLKSAGMTVTIIAAYRGKHDRLPSVFNQHGMLDDVCYIHNIPASALLGLLTPPLLNNRYRKSLIRLLGFRSRHRYGIKYWINAIYRLRAVAFRDFGIIHSHSLFSSYNLLFMKEALGIPIIMTYHGQVPRGVSRLCDLKTKHVLNTVDACVVNTDFARKELIGLGCDRDKIHIIPQGIDVKHFPFIEREINLKTSIVMLTISRLSIEKGHHVAIRALKLLENSFPGLEYHLVGDGPRREQLVTLAEELGITDRVHFHGFRYGEELKEILSSAHLFVLPSINTGDGFLVETQGVVLQEAQSSGIPAIGSRTGGIPEVILDGKTGLLFNEGSQEDLAEKIHSLVTNPELYGHIAEHGRKDVENRFSIDVVCRQLHALYNQHLQ